MQKYFEKYNINLEKNEILLFEKFLEIFKIKNSKINLSAIRDDKQIIEKHFIDSILVKVFWDIQWEILDLWTWWWFPGIPLSIINQNKKANFTLVDSIWKKVKAVNEFIKELWLTNILAIQKRAEELWQDPNHREKYDIVVSRATAYLPTLLEYTLPLLKIWWVLISYKLDNKDELEIWKKALNILWWEIIAKKDYILWWQNRTYLFVQKIYKTPQKYPRNIWEPLKNPLI